jgi:hypothetical protein
MLTAHLLLLPGCEWVVVINPSSFRACIGLSWVDLYLCYLWAVKWNAAEPYYDGTNFSCCRQQANTRQWLVALFDYHSEENHNLPLGQRSWTLKHMRRTQNYVNLSLASLHWRRRIDSAELHSSVATLTRNKKPNFQSSCTAKVTGNDGWALNFSRITRNWVTFATLQAVPYKNGGANIVWYAITKVKSTVL